MAAFWSWLKSLFSAPKFQIKLPDEIEKIELPTAQPTEEVKTVAKIETTPDTFAEYENKFNAMKIRTDKATTVFARALLLNKYKDRYGAVAKQVWGSERFWFVVALIANQESGSDIGVFKSVLHNGEKIVGTNKKTTIVPKGRGPFATWESAAIDALKDRKNETMTLGGILSFLERYNGLGYRSHGVASPYLWAMSDQYSKGHYAGDGNWKPNEVSQNYGAATILKAMMAKGYVDLGSGQVVTPPEVPDSVPAETPSVRQANFRKVAESLGYKLRADELLTFWRKAYPNANPRYYAIFDIGLPDTRRRFFVIDAEGSSVQPLSAAHGKGSDADNNDIADKFSNTANSQMSSLGIYRCAETYTGSHGLSMKLDGLQSTNSNARARAIVVHPADYVKDGGLVGRSWGCPALDPKYSAQAIEKLHDGSPLFIFKS